MSSALTPFAFDDAMLRVHTDNKGNPWFVAKDVCRLLDLGNVTEATRNMDDDELTSALLKSGGQGREMFIVSESGLYSLIFRSRKPEAKRFRKWVTAEVLPALRKTGAYAAPGAALALPDAHAAALRLKPALRERLLSDALQAARIAGASTVEEVEALYARFCLLVSDKPAPVREHGDWFDHFLGWVESCVQPGAHGTHTRAEVLYGHFLRWMHQRRPDLNAPSQKLWGAEMAKLYRRIKSGNICYQAVFAEGVDDAPRPRPAHPRMSWRQNPPPPRG